MSPEQLQDTEHSARTHYQPQLGITHTSLAMSQQQTANPGAITESRHAQIRDDDGHTGNDGGNQLLTNRARIREIDLIRQHHDSRPAQAFKVTHHNFPTGLAATPRIQGEAGSGPDPRVS
jgi:hypothetical protein